MDLHLKTKSTEEPMLKYNKFIKNPVSLHN
jgi:hypothetical protein